jgi:hypothetical protein
MITYMAIFLALGHSRSQAISKNANKCLLSFLSRRI